MESQGVYLHWNDQEIAEVISASGPTGSAPVIDVSHLKSDAAEKLLGLVDEGQVALEVNFIADDAAQKALIADRKSRTKRVAKVFLTGAGGQIVTFDAYCSGVSISIGVNQAIRGNITLEVDGEVNHSPLLGVNTDYVPSTGVIVLGIADDTFHIANSASTANWAVDYGTSGLSAITDVTRNSSVEVAVTLNASAGSTVGSHDLTFQAKAAALDGVFPTGILKETIIAGAGPVT